MTIQYTIMQPEYKSFRQNLEYIISDIDVKSKEQLQFIMAQRGFRKLKDGTRLYPEGRQLDLAFEWVTERQIQGQWKGLEHILFRTEKYKRHTIYRSTSKEPIIYKNRQYRKGQFLPKGYYRKWQFLPKGYK